MSRNIERLDERTSTIHLTLQGKGGVGKSLVASILAQYFRHHGREIRCIDSDPVNQTFSQYAELGAEHLALMRDGRIDSGGFDILLHRLINEEGTFIVDNGASTFVPLWSFIVESNALEMLSDAGRKLFVHTIITGGQALGDTLKGFKSLAADIVTVKELLGHSTIVVTMRYAHTNVEAKERAVLALGTRAKPVTVLPKPRRTR
jgi:CobQ/CobB/MinD/ParA family nucleotide binding protein